MSGRLPPSNWSTACQKPRACRDRPVSAVGRAGAFRHGRVISAGHCVPLVLSTNLAGTARWTGAGRTENSASAARSRSTASSRRNAGNTGCGTTEAAGQLRLSGRPAPLRGPGCGAWPERFTRFPGRWPQALAGCRTLLSASPAVGPAVSGRWRGHALITWSGARPASSRSGPARALASPRAIRVSSPGARWLS